MLNTKSIFAALLFFLFINTAQSQPYYFRHYQVENGLSNNAAICSLQDKKGFIWFGTKDGLNRFDGYTFKIFRSDADNPRSIGNNFIHSLYEDESGVLWVGTESGLYQYDAATESFARLKTATTIQIRDIRSDGKGNLWFISGFSLCKYNKAANKIEEYPAAQWFSATSICIGSGGTVWAGTDQGMLQKYNAATNTFTAVDLFNHSKAPVSKWIEKIYTLSNGSVLVGTSNQGAKIFDTATVSYKDILTYNADKTELFVRNFLQTNENEIWMATESGIFIYHLKTGSFTNLKKKYNDAWSISDNAVYTFCTDKEGGIWAGTYFGGVNYYPKQYTFFKKTFSKIGENSLSGNVIREVTQDRYQNLWIGTEDAGLNKWDARTGRFTNFTPAAGKNSLSYFNIHGLLADSNELWIGTFEHGLDVMNINTGNVVRHYVKSTGDGALKSNFIYCIYKTPAGEIMLGTTVGAYVYNRKTDDFSPLPAMPLYNWYTSLLKDKNGIIWAGTFGNGVNFYNTITGAGGNFRYNVNDKKSLRSDRVNSMFEDSRHNLWFATEGGLSKFNQATNNFKTYTTLDGLPANFIISILEDAKQNLWISTTKGLVCFNPATEAVNVYTKANGLLSDQFNFSSAYKDGNGRMYFGSAKGLIHFHPSEFVQNNFTPPLYITGFQVYNNELAIGANGSPLKKTIIQTEKITLPYNQSTFSIDFAALNYTAPEMVEYAYKMEGLDKDWTYLKSNRKVYFTELAAGRYTLKIKAANSSGVWNQQETTLVIEIRPPWWWSVWAYCLYAVLLMALVYYAVRNYHKNVEEKNKRKIELLQVAKEKEIFQAKIEFFTNVAHEIKTPLTLIKGPLEKVLKIAKDIPELSDRLRIMERNTNRLIDLTTQLLDFRQTEIKGFSLNFVKADIAELLQEMFLNFKPLAEQKNLSFTLSLPRTKVYGFVDAEALNKILSNLLSNAIKYADAKAELRLLPFKEGDDFFILEITNDGYLIPYEMKEKIFEPFFRLKETEKQKGTGIGLALSRSLTELHNGLLALKEPESNLNTFFLKLPVHQQNEFNLSVKLHEKPPATTANNNA